MNICYCIILHYPLFYTLLFYYTLRVPVTLHDIPVLFNAEGETRRG